MTEPQPAPGFPPSEQPATASARPLGLGRLSLYLAAGAVLLSVLVIVINGISFVSFRLTPVFDVISFGFAVLGLVGFLASVVALVFGVITLRRKGEGQLSAAAGTALAASYILTSVVSQLVNLSYAIFL